MNTESLLIIYQSGQAARAIEEWRSAKEGEKPVIISFDVEAEFLLKDADIPFRSGKNLRGDTSVERYVRAEEYVHAFLESAASIGVQYRGTPIFELFSFSFQIYLCQLMYYLDAFAGVAKAYPSASSWSLFASSRAESPTGIVLARDAEGAAVRAARCIADRTGAPVSIRSGPSTGPLRTHLKDLRYRFQQSVAGALVGAVNTLVSLLSPRRRLCLLISDYWRNVGPVIEGLPDSECVFLERSELRAVGLRALLEHRMRFTHMRSYLTLRGRRGARAATRELEASWRISKEKMPPFVFLGIDLAPLIKEALDTVVAQGMPDAVLDIESAFSMLERLAPQKVLLRASVSHQTHFATLALVARALGIPSLEVQHGLEYLGPGSVTRRHTAEYIATYGKLSQDELASLGYDRTKLLLVGSPRFDVYAGVRNEKTAEGEASVLVVAPDVVVGPWFDSYDVLEYYEGVAKAVAGLPVHLWIKIRPTALWESFQRRAIAESFSKIPFTIAQYESLSDVLPSMQALISCYSTIVVESLQCGVPAVVAAFNPVEQLMAEDHFSRYVDAGALAITTTVDELQATVSNLTRSGDFRTTAVARGRSFIEANYIFDGKAAERIRTLFLLR